ncbi:hypothetical protein [Streptomyces sp. NRRL F-5135]|uniref:hypothetical protein n=1 Tax=Streptomyces sp. NRRL F-5135 TaxID=1463858 RepID=UPI0007C59464|nr:hypothetical protein [Streptomyces sp. NRRL F-5135]
MRDRTEKFAQQTDEALRRVVAEQIGPRRPGVLYDNQDGIFTVLDVITDPSEARRILKRRAAQFAVTVHDHITGTVSTIGTVWTGSDRVLKAVAA